MEYVPFSNKKTAKKFQSLIEIDQWVHVPARQGDGQCYRGMISDIDPEAAARAVRFGDNRIVAIGAATTTAKVIDINQ